MVFHTMYSSSVRAKPCVVCLFVLQQIFEFNTVLSYVAACYFICGLSAIEIKTLLLLARDTFVKTNRRCIATMFDLLSVRLSV